MADDTIRILLVNSGCGFIESSIKSIIEDKGFRVDAIDAGFTSSLRFHYRLRFFVEVLAELGKKTYSSIIMCGPLSRSMILWLTVLLFTGPSRIVMLISPSTKHERPVLGFLYSTLASLITKLLRLRGKRILVVYTTPLEKFMFEQSLSIDMEAVYHPYLVEERRRASRQLRDNPPVIFIYSINEYGAKWIPGTVLFLEELGIRPLIILGLEEPVGKCPAGDLMACVYSDDYDPIIRDSTIVVILHASPGANLVLSRAIHYGRPVIAHPSIGMSHVYKSTGLVVFEENPGPESIATKVLRIINTLDTYRKLSLRTVVQKPSRRFFEEALLEFLK